jgi:hypothetical protein
MLLKITALYIVLKIVWSALREFGQTSKFSPSQIYAGLRLVTKTRSEELPQVLEKNLSAHKPIILARGARPKVLETFQIREIFPKNALLLVL